MINLRSINLRSSFSVILSWKLKLVNVPKIVTVFQVPKTLEQNATEDDGSAGSVEDNKTISVNFIGQFLGRKERLLSMMNQKFPELGLVAEACTEVTYIQSMFLFSLFSADDSPTGLLNRDAYKLPFKAKSDFVDKPISKEGLNFKCFEILLKQYILLILSVSKSWLSGRN
ncbi:hypothetical protein POM88_049631 [Heracleum sosnowskyi]|uniref:Uncharacterized protein n=1 Tax=Heracleum sosnowskyi TaxID=360622 RepID=A0AAD8GVZ3_9APIA|nr:hypothetical protein POM88_049631 [Heracleum sosnowskyi]